MLCIGWLWVKSVIVGGFPTKEYSCHDSDSSLFAMSQSFAAISTVTILVNHQNDDCVCVPVDSD